MIQNKEDSPDVNLEKISFYGGWIRVFRYWNFLWVIGYPLFFAVSMLVILDESEDINSRVEFISYLVEFLPSFLFSLFIFKAIVRIDEETPNKIISLLNYELGLKIVVGLSLYALHAYEHVPEKPAPILGDLIYFFIWLMYFRKSKRVRSLYGANATRKL